jgi:hypothetical protein
MPPVPPGGVHKNIGFADPSAPHPRDAADQLSAKSPPVACQGAVFGGLPDVRTWHDRNYSSSAPPY